MPRRGMRRLGVAGVGFAVALNSGALAEPPATAPGQPVAKPQPPADPDIGQVVEELERAGAKRPTIDPVSSPATISKSIGQTRLVPQGTFLPSRKGRLIGSGTASVFVFAPDAEGKAEPPMVIMPNEFLAAMERSAQERGADTLFTVSGQVFAYHNRNYLLITTRPVAETAVKAEAAKPAPDKPASPPARVSDPAVERILTELREAGAGSRTAQPVPAAPRNGDRHKEGKTVVIPEGTFLAARRGRVVRAANGDWVFTVDSDAQAVGAGAGEPPMTLLACQNLAVIERTAEQRGEAITFTVSGQVFSYRDRNFLLPTMYVVNRRSDEVLPNQ